MIKAKKAEKKAVKKAIKLTDIFDYSIVGYTKPNMQVLKPYYTKVMRGIKNLKGEVVEMDIDDFLECPYMITGQNVIGEPRNPFMLDEIKSGKMRRKFALPWINHIIKKCHGGGRAVMCKMAGMKRIPVLVCGAKKAAKESKK